MHYTIGNGHGCTVAKQQPGDPKEPDNGFNFVSAMEYLSTQLPGTTPIITFYAETTKVRYEAFKEFVEQKYGVQKQPHLSIVRDSGSGIDTKD